MGVYIQVNADSITGGAGRKIKKFIGALLDEAQTAEDEEGSSVCREKVRGRIYAADILRECERDGETAG